MEIKKLSGVPPVMPVVRIQPTDNGYRPPADPRLAFAGRVRTQAGGAALTCDELTFGGPEKAALREGLYGPDGKLI